MPLTLTPVTPVSLTLDPVVAVTLDLAAVTPASLTLTPVGTVDQPPLGDKKRRNQDFEDIKTLYPTFADLKADS